MKSCRFSTSLTALVSISIFLFLLLSCQGKNRRTIIPEKEFIEVLVDLHLADAIASEKTNLDHSYRIDSASLYGALFKKHDISRAMFDSTMSYYTKRPDDFQKVYNKVTARLKNMEVEIAADIEDSRAREEELVYHDSLVYSFPPLHASRIEIDVPVSGTGTYTVSVNVNLYPDDSSLNPRMSIYFYYDNDTPEGNRNTFIENMYTTRDGTSKTYSSSKQLSDPKVTHIKGYIVNYSNADTLFRRHMVVSDIKITRKNE